MSAAGLGQRLAWRLGMWSPPPVYPGESRFPPSSEGTWQGPRVAGAQNALGLLSCQPLRLLCVCVCVCVIGSHGFWSILKRLCHGWPGRQAACSKATAHFFSQPDLVQVENIRDVDASSLLLHVLQAVSFSLPLHYLQQS